LNTIFDYEHPYVCTDATVFTIKTEEPDSYRKLPTPKLSILLYQRSDEPFKDKWCLPGGFLNIDELPEDNIRRKLNDKTQVKECYLEQLFTFCDVHRDPRARVISITYLGLMNESESKKIKRNQWFDMIIGGEQLKFYNQGLSLTEQDFGFDHYSIIVKALERLQSKILYSDIVFNLLPKEFTLTQMQNIYETILGKKDTAANFRRKICGFVQETGRYTSDQGHRPAMLFTKKINVK
jgi:8-oxo-dGTP diphosphatase